MYAVAAALDPDALPRPRPRGLRRDGAGRLHRGRGVPLPAPRAGRPPVRRPQRDGRGADRGGDRGRHPAHPARHLLPGRRAERRAATSRWTRCRRGSATATWSAGRSAVGDLRDGPTRPDRGGGALRPRGARRPRWPRSPTRPATGRGTSTSASSRPRTPRPRPSTAARPTELLARTGFLGPTATAVHATHLSDGRRRSARPLRHQLLPLPDHRAGPGRRDRSGPGPAGRRLPADPRLGPPGGGRPVRGAARAGDARAAADHPPRAGSPRPS